MSLQHLPSTLGFVLLLAVLAVTTYVFLPLLFITPVLFYDTIYRRLEALLQMHLNYDESSPDAWYLQ